VCPIAVVVGFVAVVDAVVVSAVDARMLLALLLVSL